MVDQDADRESCGAQASECWEEGISDTLEASKRAFFLPKRAVSMTHLLFAAKMADW